MMKERKAYLCRLAEQRAIKEKETYRLIVEFVSDPSQRTKLQSAFQDALMYAADERDLLARAVDASTALGGNSYAKLIGQ